MTLPLIHYGGVNQDETLFGERYCFCPVETVYPFASAFHDNPPREVLTVVFGQHRLTGQVDQGHNFGCPVRVRIRVVHNPYTSQWAGNVPSVDYVAGHIRLNPMLLIRSRRGFPIVTRYSQRSRSSLRSRIIKVTRVPRQHSRHQRPQQSASGRCGDQTDQHDQQHSIGRPIRSAIAPGHRLVDLFRIELHIDAQGHEFLVHRFLSRSLRSQGVDGLYQAQM